MRTQLLLPLPKERYFGYALIYKGFNVETEEDIEFEGQPFGLEPEQGLQMVTFNKQVFDSVQATMMLPSRPGASDFYYPDPAAPSEGVLIYVWNRSFPSPINQKAGKLDGFGYAGGVETRYFKSPTNPTTVDLTLPDSFLEHYYENRKPWSSVLRGIHGLEQVRMIAEIAPELKGPCKFAWQNAPELMAAWEEAFRHAPDDCDFYEVLEHLYGNDEQAGEMPRFQGRRSVGSNELVYQNEEETVDDVLDSRTVPATQTLADTRSRVTTPDPDILRSRSVPAGGTPKPLLKSPLRAASKQLFETPAGFEIEDDAND
jgi:hypothetical protein